MSFSMFCSRNWKKQPPIKQERNGTVEATVASNLSETKVRVCALCSAMSTLSNVPFVVYCQLSSP